MDAGRVLHYPITAFHCQVSWLVALRRGEAANFRLSKSTILCSEHFPSKDFHFPARAQESFDSHSTDHGKPRKASCLPRACRFSAIGVFFFRPLFSVRRSAWNERGLRSRERHTLRESVLLTPVGQMMRPLTIESSA